MKFRVETYTQKKARLQTWHRWFAWKPVRLGETDQVMWLQWVLRKGEYHVGSGDMGAPWWYWDFAETEFDLLKH